MATELAGRVGERGIYLIWRAERRGREGGWQGDGARLGCPIRMREQAREMEEDKRIGILGRSVPDLTNPRGRSPNLASSWLDTRYTGEERKKRKKKKTARQSVR